ncbi:MAG: hypothetical protein ACREO8_08385, partial [Luteimonas sp.]
MVAELVTVLDDSIVIREANQRYSDTDAYQATLVARYRKYAWWYAPLNGDQWPEDAGLRPGKIHMTINIIKPAVDVESRLQAKLPRVSLVPINQSPAERARAELTEKLMLSYLEASDWESWMQTLCRVKAIYGKGILKVSYDAADKRPAVTVVENPANLRIGWGASDFSEMDWALYEYKLSPTQIMRRWPHLTVSTTPGQPTIVMQKGSATHADPLNQRTTPEPLANYQPSTYEGSQVLVWDYWYRKGDEVYNCIIVGRS